MLFRYVFVAVPYQRVRLWPRPRTYIPPASRVSDRAPSPCMCVQCAIWNTWGPITEAALVAFPGWGELTISSLTNVALIAFIVCMAPYCWLLDKKGQSSERSTLHSCVHTSCCWLAPQMKGSVSGVLLSDKEGQLHRGSSGDVVPCCRLPDRPEANIINKKHDILGIFIPYFTRKILIKMPNMSCFLFMILASGQVSRGYSRQMSRRHGVPRLTAAL